MDIQALRDEFERVLRANVKRMDQAAGFHTSNTASTTRVFVQISPISNLNVTIVSPLFREMDADETFAVFQQMVGDSFSEEELARLDIYHLLTPDEAKTTYPSYLREMEQTETLSNAA